MSYHVAAYSTSIAQNQLLPLNLAFDEHFSSNTQGAALPVYDADILAVYGMGATMNRLLINAPSLRQLIYPDISPFEIGAAVPSYPRILLFGENNKPRVKQAEAVQPFAQQGAAAAEQERCIVMFQQSHDPAPPGIVYPFRFTASIAGVADAWAGGILTPVDTIPFGRYAIVGMSVVGANILAARLVPPSAGPRPGVIASNALGAGEWNWFRSGRQGKLMEFVSTALPTLQIFCVGANAAQTVWLDLVRIGLA